MKQRLGRCQDFPTVQYNDKRRRTGAVIVRRPFHPRHVRRMPRRTDAKRRYLREKGTNTGLDTLSPQWYYLRHAERVLDLRHRPALAGSNTKSVGNARLYTGIVNNEDNCGDILNITLKECSHNPSSGVLYESLNSIPVYLLPTPRCESIRIKVDRQSR